MNIEILDNLLRDIQSVRVAVAGDFCLDAYWILHPGGSEVSVETGLTAEAVQRHYYNPGGAGNIVANLAALAPRSIQAIGVIGPDIFGAELLRKLAALGVDASTLVIQPEGFDTYTFAKRILNGVEQPRIDFGFTNRRTPQTNDQIFDRINSALTSADILIFNQQIPGAPRRRSLYRPTQCPFCRTSRPQGPLRLPPLRRPLHARPPQVQPS